MPDNLHLSVHEIPHHRKETFMSGGMPIVLWTTFWSFVAFYGPQPLLPSIREAFNLSQSTTGLLMTLAILPLGVAPIVYGFILSAMPPKRVLMAATCMLSLVLLIPYLSTNFGSVLLARLLQGILLPAILLTLMTHVSSLYKGRRLQIYLTLYSIATMTGAFSGRLFAGYVASVFDWRTSFLALSIMAASSLLPLFFLRASEGTHHHPQIKEIPAIFRQPGMLPLMLLGPVSILVHASLMNFLPFRLQQLYPSITSFQISLFYLTAFLSALLMFRSAPIIRLCGGENRVLLYGSILYCCSLFVMLNTSIVWIVTGLFMISIAYALIYTTIPGMVNRYTDHAKGITNGVYLSMFYLGSSSGTFFPGLMYSSQGWTAYIFLLQGISLLLIALTLVVQRLVITRRK